MINSGPFSPAAVRPGGPARGPAPANWIGDQLWAAFEASPIGVALTDEDYRFLSVNPAFCAMIGHSEAALLASTYREITATGSPDATDITAEHDAAYRRAAPVGSGVAPTARYDRRFVHPYGRVVWCQVHLTAAVGPQGQRYRLAQTVDITAPCAGDVRRHRRPPGRAAGQQPQLGIAARRRLHREYHAAR